MASADTARPSDVRLLFADVVVPRRLSRPFTYFIPPHLRGRIQVGSMVRVPFGRTVLDGLVVSLSAQVPTSAFHLDRRCPVPERLREIRELAGDRPDAAVPAELLAVIRLVSERYLATLGQCLRLIDPSPSTRRNPCRYVLTATGHDLLASERTTRLSPVSREVLLRLAAFPKGLTHNTLRRRIGPAFDRTVSTLSKKGMVCEVRSDDHFYTPARRRLVRDQPSPYRSEPGCQPQSAELRLPEEWRLLEAAIAAAKHRAFLLCASPAHRMAYLFKAAEAVLAQRRSMVLVTPEIAQAEVLAGQLEDRWKAQVVLFHSGLPAATRLNVWRRIEAGHSPLVVGTRSAVFAPLRSLGMIYVHDEHDPLLKEESAPRYHAREVAWIRARIAGAVLLLGSGHPSSETLWRFQYRDRLPRCSAEAEPAMVHHPFPTPLIHVVDLKTLPYDTLLSDLMVTGIETALNARAGAILFINRKGFASALVCRACGNAPRCSRCSVALAFYRGRGRLICHYCGQWAAVPDACPVCLAARLEPVGSGTERIEDAVRRRFSSARIARLDRSMARPTAGAIRRLFSAGDLDLLIGTQALFHSRPFPTVGFVGVVHADAGLHLPDFQAGERTYHTLMDVIAMARDREAGGTAVIQTFLPHHHVMEAVAAQDPTLFYDQEGAFRKMLGYPPFSEIISLRMSGRREAQVKAAAEQWAQRLRSQSIIAPFEEFPVDVWGPVPAPRAKMRDRYRWQILVKSASAERVRSVIRATLGELEVGGGRNSIRYEIDVDPVALL